MNRKKTLRTAGALGALALASAAGASPMLLATTGDTLYRVGQGGGVESFQLSDTIISQTVLSDGTILAFSSTRSSGSYEVYELVGADGPNPSLSLLNSARSVSHPTYTDVNGQLYSVRSDTLYTVDPAADYAVTNAGSLGLGNPGGIIGGSAYDPATDTFYVVSRDGNVYTVDYSLTRGSTPAATLLGGMGLSQAQNHGAEFFDGGLYAAVQNQNTNEMSVGEIDTATGAFSAWATLDLTQTGGLAPTSLAVIPTPGSVALAGVGLLAIGRRRKA